MGIDQIKIIYTYSIATIVIIGGGWIVYTTRLDPPEISQSLSLLMSGFIGAAIQFVFNRETATNAARQTERAISQGVASATAPFVSTSTGV